MTEARLYVVATPIGNLDDITLRALEVLAGVDLIAAEDTRRTRVLLMRHRLEKPIVSLQEHNEQQKAPVLVNRLRDGESIALVSDAGTPLLSDPGFRLVSLALEAGIETVTVPGPSAITAALSISGMPTDRFAFEGFLPARKAARLKVFQGLEQEPRTLVFFESSHRVRESLADLADVFGIDRTISVCREMTKQFETVLRGTVTDVMNRMDEDPNQLRGEFVLVVAGNRQPPETRMADAQSLAHALLEYLPASKAARVAARIHDVSRRDLYKTLE